MTNSDWVRCFWLLTEQILQDSVSIWTCDPTNIERWVLYQMPSMSMCTLRKGRSPTVFHKISRGNRTEIGKIHLMFLIVWKVYLTKWYNPETSHSCTTVAVQSLINSSNFKKPSYQLEETNWDIISYLS